MYFETHAHYDDNAFDGDRYAVIEAVNADGVELMLNPGCDIQTSRMAVEFSEKYSWIYAAVGIHPQSAAEVKPEDYAELESMLSLPKVMALGEIGLDYHYPEPSKDAQIEVFSRQLEIAHRLNMPVIIHDREAHRDCLDLIDGFPGIKCVFHCYSGSLEFARELIQRGHYISFTGAVTFKNARKLPDVAAWVPDDRIMIETDSPYMAPVPVRGQRNDSRNLMYICKKIAELRGVSAEELAKKTLENGKRFFGIK